MTSTPGRDARTGITGARESGRAGDHQNLRGGWWHEYVCPSHHVELLGPDGTAHQCQYGCRLTGEPWNSAWRALANQADARRFGALADRAGAGDRSAADSALDWLDIYATAYRSIPVEHTGAKEWMVPGRLFQQALSEMIWASAVGSGVWTLAGALDDSRLDRLRATAIPLLTSLGQTAVAARDRTELRSNYVAWFNAAGALTSGALTRLGEETPDEGWIAGPLGLHEQVRAAILDDGWEWEASTYYHAFVLLAYLLTLRGHNPADLPDDVAERIVGMIGVLGAIATPDGVLPSLHDSPYRAAAADEALTSEHQRIEVLELADVAELARQFVRTDALAPLAAWCQEVLSRTGATGALVGRSGWFTGLPPSGEPAGTPATQGSRLFPDAGYAVVRPAHGTWQAVLDFGPHGGSHGHLDKLSLYVYGAGVAWQPDPGVVPYGSRLRHDVYRTTRAHPAFSVDDTEQAECAGTLVRWIEDSGRTIAVAEVDTAYPGVVARRHLVVVDRLRGGMLDILELHADRPRRLKAHIRPAVPVTVEVRQGGWGTFWGGATALTAVHACSGRAALEVVPGWSPASDPAAPNHWLDWTVTADRAVFATFWMPGFSPGPGSLGPTTALPSLRVSVTDVTVHDDTRERETRYDLTTGEVT
jgi:hypothetical protein